MSIIAATTTALLAGATVAQADASNPAATTTAIAGATTTQAATPAHTASSTTQAATAVLAGASTAHTDASVPGYYQQLANSCEASSLRMVLAARGRLTSDRDVLAHIGVDMVHRQYGHGGPLSGDPYRAFVGDPDGSEMGGSGYGVFAPPVAAAARSFGLTVLRSGEHIGVADLYQLVANGHPAIVWVDYLWRHMGSNGYDAYDGRWIPYSGPAEHTVVLTAVRADSVRVNDPARGVTWVSRQAFEAGYFTYRDMAVVVS
jgi:uncharacterized protein YvpB